MTNNIEDRVGILGAIARSLSGKLARTAALALLSTLPLTAALESDAHAANCGTPAGSCYWRKAQYNIKAAVDGTYNGAQYRVWALSAEKGPGGGQKVVKGREWCQGNCEYPNFVFDVDGTAEGTSIAVERMSGNIARPWLVAKDSSVWYRQSDGWYMMPTNRCEGGNLTVRQTVGDPALAVAYGTNIYVIDGNYNIRWWGGYCWAQMPSPPGTPKEISVWTPGAVETRTNPWVVATDGTLSRWTGYAWVTVTAGTGKGVGRSSVIGMDGASIWFLNAAGNSFSIENGWGANGAISQVDGLDWVVAADGTLYKSY